MRFFPSALVIALCLALFQGSPTHADDDLDDKHDRVQQEIRETQEHLEHMSAEARKAAARLAVARKDLNAARARVATVERQLKAAKQRDRAARHQLAVAEQRLATARARLAAGRAALAAQRDQVVDTVVGEYETGDPRLRQVSAFLEAESPADFVIAREAHEIITDRQEDIYADLDAAEEQLTAQKNEVQAAEEQAEAQREAAAGHLAAVRTLTAQAKAARTRMWRQVKSTKALRQAAARARERDLRELRELRRREERIRMQILRARGGGNYKGAIAGFLTRPVDGPVTSDFGPRTHPIYGYSSFHNGIDFGAPCGAPTRAGASGRVIETYTDSVYGMRLYLYIGRVNGANTTLVYNHLSGYSAGEGQWVGRGDTVARVGTTGWSTGCHLHFTVLRNGVPVDPAGYL